MGGTEQGVKVGLKVDFVRVGNLGIGLPARQNKTQLFGRVVIKTKIKDTRDANVHLD